MMAKRVVVQLFYSREAAAYGSRLKAGTTPLVWLNSSIQREALRIAAEVGGRAERLTVDRAIEILAPE